MPTAAKLTAAIVFAIVGYVIFIVMVPSFGDTVVPSYLLPLCLGAGIWSGWVLCGAKTDTVMVGIGTGFTAVVAIACWILFIMSFVQMIQLSLRRRYDGPMEAAVDVFNLVYENAVLVGTPTMGVTLLAGGLIGGFITGIMGWKFPR